MSPRRFLVSPADLERDVVELGPGEAAHARKVLRLGPGDEVWLLDGQGRRARARVERADRAGVACRVLDLDLAPAPGPRLVLCPGLLKAPAMDLLAVKLTELCVDQVRPFFSQRSVVRGGEAGGKVGRWRRLAAQALKQCGAGRAPVFHEPLDLAGLLDLPPAGALRLLVYEEERGLSLAQALAGLDPGGEVWLLVGPEGGFAPQEAEAAVAAGFTACGLGPVVLRAETASLACAAVVRFSR